MWGTAAITFWMILRGERRILLTHTELMRHSSLSTAITVMHHCRYILVDIEKRDTYPVSL